MKQLRVEFGTAKEYEVSLLEAIRSSDLETQRHPLSVWRAFRTYLARTQAGRRIVAEHGALVAAALTVVNIEKLHAMLVTANSKMKLCQLTCTPGKIIFHIEFDSDDNYTPVDQEHTSNTLPPLAGRRMRFRAPEPLKSVSTGVESTFSFNSLED